MTVRYPKATWRPLPEAERQPVFVPIQVVLHTVVGRNSPYGTFANGDNPSESHLWLSMTGAWEQFVSLHRTADANASANRTALSIETEDDGTPEDTPWTDIQLGELAKFLAWCNDPEGLVAAFQSVTGQTIAPIPLVICPSPSSPGIGWHAMWPKPNPWTIFQGKTCPGPARIAQIPALVDRASVLRSTVPFSPQEDVPMPYLLLHDPATEAIFALFLGGIARHIGGTEWTFYKEKGIPMREMVDGELALLTGTNL